MSYIKVSSNGSSVNNKPKVMKQQHKCPTCEKIVSNKFSLINHMKIHTREKPLECNDCGETFINKSAMERHIMIKHSKENTLKDRKCTICDKVVCNKTSLARHMLIHTGEKRFECNDCGKTFAYKFAMKNHIMNVHTRMEKKPKEKKSCTICDKLVPASSMSTHMRIHTKPILCNDCGKSFSSKVHLRKHRNTHHTEEALKKKKNCPVCNKMVISWGLSQHLKRHIRLKTLECSQCEKKFGTKNDLNTHTKGVHKTGDPLKCDHCDKVFYLKASLKNHMKIHTGEKPYQCTFCDMRFAESGNMLVHMRLHTGERPFFCSQCDKAFICRGLLNDHDRAYHKEKIFKCSTCSKTFSQNSVMKRHLRQHQETRPYKCKKCPKTFKLSFSCQDHIKICRATKRDRNTDDEEPEEIDTVFRPAFEQFGPHQMKKCSVFINRLGYIDDAVLGGYKSIVLVKSKMGQHRKLL